MVDTCIRNLEVQHLNFKQAAGIIYTSTPKTNLTGFLGEPAATLHTHCRHHTTTRAWGSEIAENPRLISIPDHNAFVIK